MPAGIRFFVSDPTVIGIVAWVGLAVTVAGFSVSIYQILKIKNASAAANAAVSALVKIVRSQEQSARISDARWHLSSAQDMMRELNAEAAAAHLSIGWNALIAARELAGSPQNKERIGLLVVTTRRLLDDLNRPGQQLTLEGDAASQRYDDITSTISALGALAAKLNATLAGIGDADE